MSDFGDVERLKKMNQMIPELKKHGFATFNDEASELSQGYLKEEVPIAPPKVSEDTGVHVNFEKFKGQVNQRVAAVEGSVKQVIEKMNEIIKKINELEQRPKTFSASNEVPRSQPEQKQEQPKQEPPKQDNQPEGKGKGAESQSRYGKYQPGDVDIGDIFYFGNK